MFKIENSLLLKKPTVEISLISIIDEYYKEMHMLISNIYLANVSLDNKVGITFPIKTNLYDASWYKNLVVASNIIFDRLHMVVDPNIKYGDIFNDSNKCDFKALAYLWNKINFIVKYNLPENEWNNKTRKWNINATTRKIEEILANHVKIDLDLLKSVDFDLNTYKSIPSQLNKSQSYELENLLDVLVEKEEIKNPESTEKTIDQQITNQNAQPIVEEKSTTTSLDPEKPIAPTPVILKDKSERGPVSPLKKEMELLLKWISLREEDAKTYKTKMRMGYDPRELKLIDTQLNIITEEIKANNVLISEVKKFLPVDPLKKEMDKLLFWINERNQDIKKHKRRVSGLGLIDDINNIQKAINNVNNEINLTNEMLSNVKQYLPKDPMTKELSSLLKWIEYREADIRTYKKNLKGETLATELKRIEKEMKLVDARLHKVDDKIVILNRDKPVDPLKLEMDELLKWIVQKERALAATKKQLIAQSKKIQSYNQKSEDINKQIAEASKSLEKTQIDINKAKVKKVSATNSNEPKKTNNSLVVKKQRVTSNDDGDLEKLDKEMAKVKKQYQLVSVKYQNQLSQYRKEAKILQTAFEVLPKSLQEGATKKLPNMIDHLLDEGFISEKKGTKTSTKRLANKMKSN